MSSRGGGRLPIAARFRAWLRGLPAPVWAMAMIYGVGGAMCVLAAAFPISAHAPIALARVVGVVCLVITALLLRFGPAMRPAGLQALALAGTVGNSVLVSACSTKYGAALNSFAFLWVAIYAGQFFEPRAVRVQGIAIVIGSGVALKVSGLPGMVTAWVLIAGSSVLAGEVLARVNSRLRAELTTDPLTGLLNRAGFLAAAARVRALADRGDLPVCIALIDLDDFKQVNDRRGHAAGDELLDDLGRAWRAELRGAEILARVGGDEFALLLAGAAPDGAERALRRLHTASTIGWSAGVVGWGRGESLEQAMVRADAELYRAKRERRGCRQGGPWTAPSVTTPRSAVV